MTGALAASVGLIRIGSTTVTAYIILASGRVEILITDSVFKRYSVPSILDKHKGIQWLQFVNRYSPPASNSLGTRPSINQKKGCGKRAGWKYEPGKACGDFSAEPDTRTNVLSRLVFTAFHNEAKCQHGGVDPRPSTVQVFLSAAWVSHFVALYVYGLATEKIDFAFSTCYEYGTSADGEQHQAYKTYRARRHSSEGLPKYRK